MIRKTLTVLFTLLVSLQLTAQNYKLDKDISYIPKTEVDTYRVERCKLDIYYPTDSKNFTTIIWFHGGGLEGGEKYIPEELKAKGIAVVAVNYRLSPKAENPKYTQDAAEAVAWTFKHIGEYGGDASKIFISGHSAGGYLVLMLGLDKSYLQQNGIDANKLRGMIPISGQTNTHYTIRKERELPMNVPIVDKYAPLNQVRKGICPTLLITGDRNLEMTARYEENAHLYAVLKAFDNKDFKLEELNGFDHNTVVVPACIMMVEWIKKQLEN